MPRKASPRKRKSPEPDDFKSVARRLGCDEDPQNFEEKLAKIAKATVKPARLFPRRK